MFSLVMQSSSENYNGVVMNNTQLRLAITDLIRREMLRFVVWTIIDVSICISLIVWLDTVWLN